MTASMGYSRKQSLYNVALCYYIHHEEEGTLLIWMSRKVLGIINAYTLEILYIYYAHPVLNALLIKSGCIITNNDL
jgi:hypothetical protein